MMLINGSSGTIEAAELELEVEGACASTDIGPRRVPIDMNFGLVIILFRIYKQSDAALVIIDIVVRCDLFPFSFSPRSSSGCNPSSLSRSTPLSLLLLLLK